MTETLSRPTRIAPPPADSPAEEFAQPAPSSQPPAVRAHDPEPRVMPAPIETRPMPTGSFGKVVEAIAGVMAEIKPVEKLGYNKFHGYSHARIGDLNAELTPLMGKHGIVVFQNEVGRDMFDNGSVVAVRYEFTVVHKSGEVWPERPVLTGMARCRTTKESFDDKTFNKCHTAARKYFLIGLFQIPVSDEDDADADHGADGPAQRPRPTRRAPSPDGKATPDVVAIVDGEHPSAWAERFKKACGQSDSPATIQKWYQANIAIFEKLKRFVGEDSKNAGLNIYSGLIDFMDQLEVKLAGGKKADPISSGPLPGSPALDREIAAEPEPAPKPRSRRAPAPKDNKPEDAADASEETKLWLESLENAFSSCEDAEALGEAQSKHMTPKKGEVSQEAWADAVKIVRQHLDRISGGAQ